jgi:hypothetical protein
MRGYLTDSPFYIHKEQQYDYPKRRSYCCSFLLITNHITSNFNIKIKYKFVAKILLTLQRCSVY